MALGPCKGERKEKENKNIGVSDATSLGDSSKWRLWQNSYRSDGKY
jgi:hypothetical protein